MQQQTAPFELALSVSPEKKPGIMAQEVLEEMVLYDGEREMGYSLNASARQIWNLCDGKRTVHHICCEIAGELNVDEALLYEDVKLAINELVSLGLLTVTTANGNADDQDRYPDRPA